MRKILFATAIILMVIGCTKKGKDKVFLLPKGFVGYALIIYDQTDGSEIKYADQKNKLLFEIPVSRVLKTTLKADYGRTSFPEFYYESINDQNKIPLVIDAVQYSEKEVNASMPNIGKVYKNSDGTEPVEYSIFFIGTKNDIERASEELKKIDILELI